MEGKPAKRRRVYSIEPNKVVEAMFTRNYLNYLVPALMKIKERSSKAEHQHKKIHCDVVKHEVDMAMVFSAQGFVWSNALKNKLQQREENEGTKIYDDQNNEIMSPPPLPCSKFLGNEILVRNDTNKSIKHKVMPGIMKKDLAGKEEEEEEDDDDDEDEVMMNDSQFMSLRRLIPGGEEMCNEQMVAELESYICCLQMQVNILQNLAGTS